MTTSQEFMGYSEVRKWLQHHSLRQTEIPTESVVSLPMPTRRWGVPAYAFFASPAERHPDQPTRQGPPDRWWAFHARGGALLIYSRMQVFSFSPETIWDTIVTVPASDNLVILGQLIADIQQMMDVLIADFFGTEKGDPDVKTALNLALERFFQAPLLPQYQALAPDFYSWLRA